MLALRRESDKENPGKLTVPRHTISYVNEAFESFGRPLRLSDAFVNWAELRYALESCFGTVTNNTTYLRGYRTNGVERVELQAHENVPDVLWVRRCVMPLGLRQYVPPEANVKYIKAKQDLETVQLSIDEESKAYEAFVNATDYTNYTDRTFERNPAFAKRKEALLDLCKSLEDKAGLHPSAFTETPLELAERPDVRHVSSYVKPWATYVCQNCFRVGVHFKDACYLFRDERPVKDVSFKWGAQKMKKYKINP